MSLQVYEVATEHYYEYEDGEWFDSEGTLYLTKDAAEKALEDLLTARVDELKEDLEEDQTIEVQDPGDGYKYPAYVSSDAASFEMCWERYRVLPREVYD